MFSFLNALIYAAFPMLIIGFGSGLYGWVGMIRNIDPDFGAKHPYEFSSVLNSNYLKPKGVECRSIFFVSFFASAICLVLAFFVAIKLYGAPS